MVDAKFVVASGDTVVVSGTTRTPLRQTVGNVNTAANADWYVRGTPFVLTAGSHRVEFVTYGQGQMMQANDMAYLGMINGYPVYADTDDVQAFRARLDQARATAGNDNLGPILASNAQLRTSIDGVRTIYVPLSATGCRFQALQHQEQVRKGGEEN
jgi:hypothetical protein